MKTFKSCAAALFLTCGMALVSAAPMMAAGGGFYQEGDWHQHLRGVIDRTQNDLQAAAQIAAGPKDHDRYRHAQRELSDFDRKVSRGHFDMGKLKDCIGALNDILDHNTLQASTRDAIRADNEDLKMVRDRHEH
ncbi:MAG: hypothetical protein JO340_05920 [Acidobacteriaceae bacterium]|nr:hypothetical protein [Acidobacteriaceae bacterium]